jgi:two-component system sensor histidine kinase KdpD
MIEQLDDIRPDPDVLLNRINQESLKSTRGKLKIFFGMCAGVGKTYSMLKAAHKAKADGIDVVIGIVETHKRTETEELTEGLEAVPLKELTYRQTLFKEFDIEAVIKRKPSLVLVDELAHTNIPGSRNVKRYQDVMEILHNGIDVYTTLNVQHLESRCETVKQITGSTIRETVPDSILDQTNEIELVDITPDKLIQRLAEGKVYTGESSKQAIHNFFRIGNLTALREMALRITAERVDKDLQTYKSEKSIQDIWKSGQRLMCAIGPSPYSANLIRWTRRLAYSLEAPWIAVYIETDQKITEINKDILSQNFNLVKELGGELVISQDMNIIDAIIRTAKENNVTQIIVGKSRKSAFQKIFPKNDFIKNLLKKSGDIDVYVLGGERPGEKELLFDVKTSSHSSLSKYLIAAVIVYLVGVVSYFFQAQIGYQVISLIFLMVVAILPLANFGIGPVLFTALISALSWNYFFIPPHFTFHISKPEDALMFITYFIVASITGTLSSKIRIQQTLLRKREEKTNALLNLSKKLAEASNMNDVADAGIKEIEAVFNAQVVIIFFETEKKLKAKPHTSSSFVLNDAEWAFAQHCFTRNQKVGKFTNSLPNAEATYFPLESKSGILGVLGINLLDDQPLSFDQEDLLNNFISQITNAIEREYLNDLAKQTLVSTESEKLYKTLFNSISHELKTPITTIIGAASSLNDKKLLENKNILQKFISEINIAAERLHRLVENLLDMARLESGNIKPKLDWHSVEDLLRSSVERLKDESAGYKINVNIAEDVVFKFDYALLEQALVNIIHNSIVHSALGSEITVEAFLQNQQCVINISDNGTGFRTAVLSNLFDKFYRIPGTKTGGTGLGLSISKGFIEAHSGNISAMNRNKGGAVISIKLPMK